MTRAEAQAIGDAAVAEQVRRATGYAVVTSPGNVAGAPMRPPNAIGHLLSDAVATVAAPQLVPAAASAPADISTLLAPWNDDYGQTQNDRSGKESVAGKDGSRETREIGWDGNYQRKRIGKKPRRRKKKVQAKGKR